MRLKKNISIECWTNSNSGSKSEMFWLCLGSSDWDSPGWELWQAGVALSLGTEAGAGKERNFPLCLNVKLLIHKNKKPTEQTCSPGCSLLPGMPCPLRAASLVSSGNFFPRTLCYFAVTPLPNRREDRGTVPSQFDGSSSSLGAGRWKIKSI